MIKRWPVNASPVHVLKFANQVLDKCREAIYNSTEQVYKYI